MIESEQRAAVCKIAMTWERTAFHQNVAIKQVGVDCAHLVCATYCEAGLLDPMVLATLPHLAPDWCRHTSEEGFLRIIQQHLREVFVPLPGDMAVFKLENIFGHCGLVIAWPTILHVCRRGMRVSLASVEQEPLLRRRPVRFFTPFHHK
jgi:hypothetical protein